MTAPDPIKGLAANAREMAQQLRAREPHHGEPADTPLSLLMLRQAALLDQLAARGVAPVRADAGERGCPKCNHAVGFHEATVCQKGEFRHGERWAHAWACGFGDCRCTMTRAEVEALNAEHRAAAPLTAKQAREMALRVQREADERLRADRQADAGEGERYTIRACARLSDRDAWEIVNSKGETCGGDGRPRTLAWFKPRSAADFVLNKLNAEHRPASGEAQTVPWGVTKAALESAKYATDDAARERARAEQAQRELAEFKDYARADAARIMRERDAALKLLEEMPVTLDPAGRLEQAEAELAECYAEAADAMSWCREMGDGGKAMPSVPEGSALRGVQHLIREWQGETGRRKKAERERDEARASMVPVDLYRMAVEGLEDARAALTAATAREAEVRGAKDAAYVERDRLVCALSKVFPSRLARHPSDDTTWDDDWRWIVFVELPTGQASWHIHRSEVAWFAHLRVGENPWDGHTNEEKYERLAALSAPPVQGTPEPTQAEYDAQCWSDAGCPSAPPSDPALRAARDAAWERRAAPYAEERDTFDPEHVRPGRTAGHDWTVLVRATLTGTWRPAHERRTARRLGRD